MLEMWQSKRQAYCAFQEDEVSKVGKGPILSFFQQSDWNDCLLKSLKRRVDRLGAKKKKKTQIITGFITLVLNRMIKVKKALISKKKFLSYVENYI